MKRESVCVRERVGHISVFSKFVIVFCFFDGEAMHSWRDKNEEGLGVKEVRRNEARRNLNETATQVPPVCVVQLIIGSAFNEVKYHIS